MWCNPERLTYFEIGEVWWIMSNGTKWIKAGKDKVWFKRAFKN